MCKVRIVHFSSHDVRVPMATDPFSEPGGPGDFTAPAVRDVCQCENGIVGLPPKTRGHRLFDHCGWHVCCVRSYQTVKCQWFRNNLDGLPQDELEPDDQCPNLFIINEYHPISVLLPESTALAVPWIRWEAEDRAPCFPAAELFYSATITDAAPPDEESLGLYEDRFEVQRLGLKLREEKSMLKAAINLATQAIGRLETEFHGSKGHKCLATAPRLFLGHLRIARKFILLVERAERKVVHTYQRMMRRTSFLLTMLNKMPAPGQTLTVADGSFSISREQLDLGDLGRKDVLDACEGPLNKSKDLWQHLEHAVAPLPTPKKRKGVQGPRKGPIPANHGMKGEKKESLFQD